MPPLHDLALDAIGFCWAVWMTVWIVASLGNKRTVYRQPWSKWIPFFAVALAAFALMHLLPHPFARLLPPAPACDIAGAALCALGLGWSIWARAVLGRNWSGRITLKQDHELIQRGPYRFTRHPIYTGLLTGIAGTLLFFAPSPFGIVEFVALSGAFIIKLYQEETLMTQHFPDAYPTYRAAVKFRLLPGIW